MSKLPYIKLWINDYQADTGHLSTEEHGAYLLLLFDYWWHRRGPKHCEKTLQKITKLSVHKWKNISPTVLDFFEIKDGRLYHPRIEEELKKAINRSEQARIAVNSRRDRQPTDVPTDVVPVSNTSNDNVPDNIKTAIKEDEEYGDPF